MKSGAFEIIFDPIGAFEAESETKTLPRQGFTAILTIPSLDLYET